VNETKLILLSLAILSPISGPPTHKVTIDFGSPFFSKIYWIILTVAMAIKGVVGAGFHNVIFPPIIDKAKFHPKTALGKLKAVITPTTPKGFHYSIMKCSGLSLGIT